MDIANPANRSAAVNALILYDLAKRAERHGDPYENLETMHNMAEVSWVRGDLIKTAMRPPGLVRANRIGGGSSDELPCARDH